MKVLRRVISTGQRTNLDPYRPSPTKINSKRIVDLTEHLENKHRRKPLGVWLRQRVLNLDAKSMIYERRKKDALNFIKIKNFCSSKDIIKERKRQVRDRENYLEIMYLVKDLYPDYVKNFDNKKIIQLKWVKTGTSLVAQWLRICLPVQGHGLDPWSEKIPCAAEEQSPWEQPELLSLSSRAHRLQLLKPACPQACAPHKKSHHSGKPTHHS